MTPEVICFVAVWNRRDKTGQQQQQGKLQKERPPPKWGPFLLEWMAENYF
jgi:hypothetical protein